MENENSFITKINEKRKSKTKSVLLLCGIFVFLISLSWLSSSWYSKQAIKTIKVSGNTVLTAGEINAIIDEKIMNIPNEGIELKKIKKCLCIGTTIKIKIIFRKVDMPFKLDTQTV